MRWSNKDPAEILQLGIDMAALGGGATLLVAAAAITVLRGDDPAASAMLLGAPEIAGTVVRQWIQAGVAGCEYRLTFLVDFDNGMRLAEAGSFACRIER
jgi:hypothetical protein